MDHFQSPRFWKIIKKKRNFRNILISIFIIPAIFFVNIAFYSKEPEIYMLAIIFLIPVFVIYIVFYILEKKCIKVLNSLPLDEASYIASELENEKTICYEKYNLFLTEHYIIIIGYRLDIIKYSDIIWIYNKNTQTATLSGNARQLIVCTIDHKEHPIITLAYGKKQLINFEIMNFIFHKNPSMLRGITTENWQIMNDLKNESCNEKA